MFLDKYEPIEVFKYFERLCSVPHGSGNTKIISDLLVQIARELKLKYRQDELNNVIIFKPASCGYEASETVILQGHMDMVCTKDADISKDMSQEGLDLDSDGEWIWAKGTSLGADDGIAVAMALAILADDKLEHPALECVFTVDEETGMDGARGIDLSDIKGRRLLNIDSEEEGVFTVSCAGGMRADCELPAESFVPDVNEYTFFRLKCSGLIGGHSGCEIDKGRANAIKILGRALYTAQNSCVNEILLTDFRGGRFDNVICPEAECVLAVKKSMGCHFAAFIKEFNDILGTEYAVTDPHINLTYERIKPDMGIKCYTCESSKKLIDCLFMLPQGVQEMSHDFEGLVETSLNMGVIDCSENKFRFSFSIRSSVNSRKYMLAELVKLIVAKNGGNVNIHGEYPAWAYNRNSDFRKLLEDVYKDIYGASPRIYATHGGLECGLLIEKLNGLDCVSVGPELRDIHSSRERLNIASVERLYRLIKEFLVKCR